MSKQNAQEVGRKRDDKDWFKDKECPELAMWQDEVQRIAEEIVEFSQLC